MLLIGKYLSPYTRRVAVALRVYGVAYRHEPWSAFGEPEKISPYNPLLRVPTLVLDSGEVLFESTAILDYLDEIAGPDAALIARGGEARRATLRIAAMAMGLCDKLASLTLERKHHETVSEVWIDRCRAQVGAVLAALERDREGRAGTHWFGDHLTHADVAVACAMTFMAQAHPQLAAQDAWPALKAHAQRCEGLEAFRATAP